MACGGERTQGSTPASVQHVPLRTRRAQRNSLSWICPGAVQQASSPVAQMKEVEVDAQPTGRGLLKLNRHLPVTRGHSPKENSSATFASSCSDLHSASSTEHAARMLEYYPASSPRRMPFKSKAQRRKFAQLLVEGKITPEVFEEWNRETGGAHLPERAKKKSRKTVRRKSAARRKKKATTKRRTRPRTGKTRKPRKRSRRR